MYTVRQRACDRNDDTQRVKRIYIHTGNVTAGGEVCVRSDDLTSAQGESSSIRYGVGGNVIHAGSSGDGKGYDVVWFGSGSGGTSGGEKGKAGSDISGVGITGSGGGEGVAGRDFTAI